MGVIFDTSFLIQAERRESEISQFAENREEEVFGISVITVAELLHGVHRADSTKRRLKRSAYVEKVIFRHPLGKAVGRFGMVGSPSRAGIIEPLTLAPL